MDFQDFARVCRAEKNSAVNKVVIGKDRKDSKKSIKNKTNKKKSPCFW